MQIFTDVTGCSRQTSIGSDARRLDRIIFEEMLELASLGAKVLQIRAVEFASKYDVPLQVLSGLDQAAPDYSEDPAWKHRRLWCGAPRTGENYRARR